MLSKTSNSDIFCLELSSNVSYKKKKALIDVISANGGRVSFVLNLKVNFLIRDDASNLDTYKCRTAFKLGVPIVLSSYFDEILQNKSVKIEEYIIKNKAIEENLKKGIITSTLKAIQARTLPKLIDMDKINFFSLDNDINANQFESSYHVVKWIVFHVNNFKILIDID